MVSSSRRYTPDDVVLVERFARRCASAVEGASLFRESEERRARLALLASVGDELASALELDETMRRVLDRIVPVIADASVIVLGERGRFERVAVRHVDVVRESEFHAEFVGKPVDLDGQAPVARRSARSRPCSSIVAPREP